MTHAPTSAQRLRVGTDARFDLRNAELVYVRSMTVYKPSPSLVSLLEGNELPAEFTVAGGAPVGRLLGNNVAEFRGANRGRSVVMTRSATDDDQLPQILSGIEACSGLDLHAHTVIAAPGLSGGAPIGERPDLQRLFRIVAQGEADTVWWCDPSRVSRSMKILNETLDVLLPSNVTVIFGHRPLLSEWEDNLRLAQWDPFNDERHPLLRMLRGAEMNELRRRSATRKPRARKSSGI